MNSVKKIDTLECVNDLIPHMVVTSGSEEEMSALAAKIGWTVQPGVYYRFSVCVENTHLDIRLYSRDEVTKFLKGMLAHGVDLSKQLENYGEYVEEGKP